jgi:hypothetical protein
MVLYEFNKDHNKTFIFHIKKNIIKGKFLKAVKLRTRYFAGNLFGRIYDCFFSEMIDLFEEYKKYHSREYKTFNEFLQKKYNLPAKIAKLGQEKLSKHKNTGLFLRKEHVTGDYNLEMFILSSDGALNILSAILGVPNEN